MINTGTRQEVLIDRLLSHGISADAVAGKASLFKQALDTLGNRASTAKLLYVPGRIEMLGKHTDYCGGRSLLVAAERGFCLAVAPRDDSMVEVHSINLEDTVRFPLDPGISPTLGHWSNYPMTVARRVARNFPGSKNGVTIALASDLPSAAGMSSSSALIVALFMALSRFNDLEHHNSYRQDIRSIEHLANYLGCNENGQTFGTLIGDKGVGTFGGSQDHTAILCSRRDTITQFAFCPTRFENRMSMPAGHVIVVGVSGVIAEKTGNALEAYNSVSLRARRIVELWNLSTGRRDACLADAIHSSTDATEQIRALIHKHNIVDIGNRLLPRLEQFIRESENIIPSVGMALEQNNLTTFGSLVDRSQRGAEEELGNQIPETISLCRTARQSGAIAASAFGAGFGGAVWTLVHQDDADDFIERWRESVAPYFSHTDIKPEFITTHAGPAASWL